MTVSRVNGVNLNGALASPGAAAPSPVSKFAGQILSSSGAQLANDTVSFSGKAAVQNNTAQAGTTPALIRAAAAFAGGQLTASAAPKNSPAKSMAEVFFGRSDSGSGLSQDQKVSGGGASAFGGGNNHA